MDERVLLLKLAGHWRDAAREVQNPALNACYTKRAERYLAMAGERDRKVDNIRASASKKEQ